MDILTLANTVATNVLDRGIAGEEFELTLPPGTPESRLEEGEPFLVGDVNVDELFLEMEGMSEEEQIEFLGGLPDEAFFALVEVFVANTLSEEEQQEFLETLAEVFEAIGEADGDFDNFLENGVEEEDADDENDLENKQPIEISDTVSERINDFRTQANEMNRFEEAIHRLEMLLEKLKMGRDMDKSFSNMGNSFARALLNKGEAAANEIHQMSQRKL